MAMPKLVSGTTPSAAAWNRIASEVDNLGVSCKVVRTSVQTGITTTVDRLIDWQASVFDTRGDMWDPAFPNVVTCQVPGAYTLVMAQRWPATGGSAAGQRAGKIMVNGSSVFANSIASDKRAGSSTDEGTTLLLVARARLFAGDLIYCNYWQSSGATISGLGVDLGGTYLAVGRRGPLAI